MDLSILIVNWNSKDYLRECLRSVYGNTHSITFEVIVVDNASFDHCERMLASEFPAVKFIQSERNLGFAKANNLAFESAQGRCILCLNPDTEVVGHALQTLYEALMTAEAAGAVGARLLNTDGTIQTSCIQAFPTVLNQLLDAEVLRNAFPRLPLWGTTALLTESPKPIEVDAIVGACVMLKREVFQEVGGFDERYFMYAEDIDLSFKVHAAGRHCYLLTSASVVHHGGGSSKSSFSKFSAVMMRESIFRFMLCRRGVVSALLFRFGTGVSALVRLPLSLAFSVFERGQTRSKTSSIRKWFSILRWCLGMEGWVQRGEYSRH